MIKRTYDKENIGYWNTVWLLDIHSRIFHFLSQKVCLVNSVDVDKLFAQIVENSNHMCCHFYIWSSHFINIMLNEVHHRFKILVK